jgi:hypothetical protein
MTLFTKAFASVILVAALIACGSKEQNDQEETEGGDEAGMTGKPAVCIWKEISVRETPEDKGKFKTTIYLGEKIAFLGDTATDSTAVKKTKYIKIKLIDDTEGWVRQDFIAVDATPGAVLKEATLYKRPDMMTPSGKNFKQMEFVAIKSQQDGWSEIIGKRVGDTWFSSGWVKTENLTTQAADVGVSVFYSKAMEINDEQKRAEAIQKIIDNRDFSSSVFYDIIVGTGNEEMDDMEGDAVDIEADTVAGSDQ